MRHLKHVFRVTFILLFTVVGLVLGRFLFVPESWGQYGWYRGDNIEEQKGHDINHQGDASCTACHADQAATHTSGGHAHVRCEVCHAPLTTHASGPDRTAERTAEMWVDKSVDLCATCHRALASRPTDFPQVDLKQHVEGWGQTWSDTICFLCHNPHKPK